MNGKMNKKTSKKNNGRQRSRGPRGAQAVVSVRAVNPMPKIHQAKLTYNEQLVISTSASVTTGGNYYQTSLFDPRGNAGGHQPLYFDQLAAVYGRYRIDKVDWSISGCTNIGSPMIMYCRAQPTSPFEINGELLSERPDVQSVMINTGGGPRTITGSFLPYRILGVSKQKYMDDPNYSATVGANPAIMAYLLPQVTTFAEAGSLTISVTLTFSATFFELQTVSSS